MAFSRDSNLRMGDRSEYLAQYFLSALGVSVLVPRPEDIGFDCHCSLAEQSGRRQTYRWPYWVQIGSEGSKSFKYGGLERRTCKWRAWEVEGIRDVQIPFFVGLVDKAKHRLRLFSTSPKWYLFHYVWPTIGQLQLCPDDSRTPLKVWETGQIKTSDGTSLPCFDVPLGPPIIDMTVGDIGTPAFDAMSKVLESAIVCEHWNIIYNSIGTPYFACPKENRQPNQPLDGWLYSFAFRFDKLDEQLDRIRPVCISVAGNYKYQNRHSDLEKLRPIFDLLPLSDEDRKIIHDIDPASS